MPTYDYKCRACGHAFELFQSMTEPVKRKCPRCAKSALERLIGTGAALLFKGSGFYQTDYRSDSYTKAAEADKKPTSDAKPAADAKADAKADTKTNAKPDTKVETPGTGKPAPKSDPKPTGGPDRPRPTKKGRADSAA